MAQFHLYKCFANGVMNGWYPDSIWSGTSSYKNTAAIWTLRGNTPYAPTVNDTRLFNNVVASGGTSHWITGWRLEINSDGTYTVYIDPVTEPQVTGSEWVDRDCSYLMLQKWYGGTGGYSGDSKSIIGYVDFGSPLNLNTRSITASWPNGLFTAKVQR